MSAWVLRSPAGPFGTLGKVLAVLRVTLATRLAYPAEALVQCVFMMMILFTFMPA